MLSQNILNNIEINAFSSADEMETSRKKGGICQSRRRQEIIY